MAHRAKAYALLAVLGFGLALASILDADVAYAEDGLQPGEAYVTHFSGAKSEGGHTIIDTGGTVGSIIDLRDPAQPPRSQRWLNEPQRNAVTAGEVGQVFGIALDDASPPNIYLTATSAFGLHRTPDNQDWMAGMWGPGGGPGTIWKLSAANNYQPEIFAQGTVDGRVNTGAALGNIAYDPWNKQLYVSDLETGMIHRLSLEGTDLGHFDHGTTGRASFTDAATGAQSSLPQVAFDPNSAAKIKDCSGGEFSKTPDCWNFADFRRRIWGLGVRRDFSTSEVRLYYAVWGSQGFGNPAWSTAGDDQRNAIWSVRIGPDASFDTADVRREFILPNFFSDPARIAELSASHAVSDIAFPKFGGDAVMLLAERGGVRNLGLDAVAPFARPHESRVLRYELDEYGVWLSAGRYDAGFYDRKDDGQPYLRANASGGVDFGLGYSAAWDADQAEPDQFVWMTGDSLCSPEGPCFDPATSSATDKAQVNGVQGTPVDLSNELEPAAALEPYPARGYATPDTTPAGSYMIATDAGGEPARNDATKIGDVAVYQPLPEGVAEGWMPPGWTPPGWIAPPGYVPPSGWTPPPWWTAPPDWTPPSGWTSPPWWWWLQNPPGVPPGVDLEVKKGTPSNTCPSNAKCKFEITITNTHTQAYVGPLNIADTMPKGWTLVSASGPWTCWQQGDAFSCTHPQTTLAPGQSVKLEVELQPPGAASGQPAQVQVDNCTEIDWMGGPGDGNKGNDKSCVTVTFAAAGFDLELKKAAHAVGGLGAGAGMLAAACTPGMNCKFEITVTNKGPGTFAGPLSLTDTMPAGWKFGASSAPWACQQQGIAVACTHPQTTLASGQSLTLTLDLVPSAASGAQAAPAENCAEIDWKGGAGDSGKSNDRGCETVTVGVGEPDLAIWKSGPSECVRGGACSYPIKIVNVGQGQYQGPINIEERNLQHAGLVLQSAATSITGCKDTTLGKIECDLGNVTLNPGASLDGVITVLLPADLPPALDQLKDCVKITKSVGTVSKPESCADTPLKAEFDLKITKEGPAKCFEPGPCSFTLYVWNVGNGDYEGPITITETTKYPVTLNSSKPSPLWTCSASTGKAAWPDYEVTCTHPGVKLQNAAGIAGMIGVVGPLTLTLGLSDTKQTEFKDCAKVGYKGGKPDANPNNDEVCITTPLEPSGGTLTGGAGGGWVLSLTGLGTIACLFADCTDYDFTISNAGPSTYSLPMTLRVKLPEGAKLKSAQGTQSGKSCLAGGWSCGQSGEEVICRPSDCSLGKDEKTAVHFDLRLLAEGAPSPPEGTTKTVCGELEWVAPPSGAVDIEQQQTGGMKYSRACVTTKILVGKFDLALTKSGSPECGPGGKCSYSLTVRNASQVPFSGPIKFADKLPSGWKLSGSGNTKCIQQGDIVACERLTQVLQPNWTETIRIEAQVPAKEKRNEVENCASLDYAKGQGDANAANDKSCVTTKLKRIAPEAKCRSGERWDRKRNRCVSICPEGQRWDGKKCVPIVPECPKGQRWDGKRCVPIVPECAEGERWDRRKQRCVPLLSPTEECRKKGWVWDREQCLSPADACQKKGWIWDRRNQRCVPPLSPADECRKKGWVWDGNRCLSPEEACTNKGWNWDRRRQRCVPKEVEAPKTPQVIEPKVIPLPETPKVTPQMIPGPLQILCPKGTVWSEPYKKCLPVVE